ncbi:hypothetical protein L208DRAFT_1252462 [Tricholoma matsutake]|nr:hypothetical protein L208DRAFT_1252462 [Tricholoma matsutake 945]
MSLELPGFYFDEQRNRYFPLSSKLKNVTPVLVASTSPDAGTTTRHLKRKRQRTLWNTTELTRSTCFPQQRHQAAHQVLSSHYAYTSRLVEVQIPVFGKIKAFCTTTLNGQSHRFIGDNRGWLYTSTSRDTDFDPTMQMWAADINLHQSDISSISISGALCIATCLGPTPKLSVQDLNVPGRTYLVNLHNVHDIWNSHLLGSSLLLGADKRAIYFQHIDLSSFQTLDTHSDVFAVSQQDNLIYTGARNGTISRFDRRMGKPHGQKLVDDRFTNRQRSSVLHIETVRDDQLLTSHMNGELLMFDLRFSRHSIPVMKYPGHVNSHTQRLGIALDLHHDFLFAAGEDGRIRGWSVNTGEPLLPWSQTNEWSAVQNNPFLATFPDSVGAMQVSAESMGLCLWAACEDSLYQYYLGQRQ